jgi:hypothetical protein
LEEWKLEQEGTDVSRYAVQGGAPDVATTIMSSTDQVFVAATLLEIDFFTTPKEVTLSGFVSIQGITETRHYIRARELEPPAVRSTVNETSINADNEDENGIFRMALELVEPVEPVSTMNSKTIESSKLTRGVIIFASLVVLVVIISMVQKQRRMMVQPTDVPSQNVLLDTGRLS